MLNLERVDIILFGLQFRSNLVSKFVFNSKLLHDISIHSLLSLFVDSTRVSELE